MLTMPRDDVQLLMDIEWRTDRPIRKAGNYFIFAGLCEARIFEHADPTNKLCWPDRNRLCVRLPFERAKRLVGKDLMIQSGDEHLSLTDARVSLPTPANRLFSPMVFIKSRSDDQGMYHGVRERLDALGVACSIRVERRMVLPIKGHRLIGYAVRLTGLSEEDSILVQSSGIGGKNAMGCGVFEPC